MRNWWWKIIGVLLVLYAVIAAFLIDVPALPILNETIRNLFFHVVMWFVMMALLTASLIASIGYLAKSKNANPLQRWKWDDWALEAANVGVFFGLIGIVTGMIWAKFTWGQFWVIEDPKLNGAAMGIFVYLAYLLIRNMIQDQDTRKTVSAVVNIFAFAMYMVFVNVLPRLTDSLHPGNGGNPGFSGYDLDGDLRMVFYPAILGWIIIGFWIVTLRTRLRKVENVLKLQ